jgi:hypothetical protein
MDFSSEQARRGLTFRANEHEGLGNVLPRRGTRASRMKTDASIEWAVPFRKQDAESAAEAVPAGGGGESAQSENELGWAQNRLRLTRRTRDF